MESSRIFIKGLPPTISEEEFKHYFSKTSAITDAKLIPQRRIGYVGYKTPEEAKKAVKYFNRTFIRMSRIGVEIARPISDASLPPSRKEQREQQREWVQEMKTKELESAAQEVANAGSKRKRDDESDPKLKEFLEVMQPASKTKTWATANEMPVDHAPNVKIIAVPEAESDDEYESVPKKARKESPTTGNVSAETVTVSAPQQVPPSTELRVEPSGPEATDDDWLRNRTNRLLDLMAPEDIISNNIAAAPLAIDATAQGDDRRQEMNTTTPIQVEAAVEVDVPDATIEAIKVTGRLFVRNLPYSASEDDLRAHFAPYGTLEEVHLPVDAAGESKGFLLVQYSDPAAAAEAYHNLDGEPFQGRLLHILPGSAKRENKLDEFEISKLPLKKQKQIKKKSEASSASFNWNSLYMDQDAVNSVIAKRLGVSKAEMLDPSSADSGWKQAVAETSIIQETKSYFAKNGVDLDSFKKRERGDVAILVKNFPYGMTLDELRKMFEEYGQVLRVLMPPAGTIAIVEFAQPTHARAAFGGLAYRRMKDSVLFLEKAPKDLFTNANRGAAILTSEPELGRAAEKLSAADLLEQGSAVESVDTSTLFVRNLNFITTSARLTETFKPLDGFLSARVNTKTDPKKPGQVLSMGYGFVEFRSKAQAQAALKVMNDFDLDQHRLVVKASHRGMDAADERRKEEKGKKLSGQRTKIIIKNLPFEATKKDVRSLFGTYGQLRSVRVPKKFDHSARGFAFADFITAREAENALEALKDTHLLGRRLVLEFAAGDAVDAEEEIEKMQKKVSSQVNKVALQKLTGGGRKKFNIDGDDDEEN